MMVQQELSLQIILLKPSLKQVIAITLRDYGMTLFADGGTFATKPYIGGSNYIKKMSNYGNGQWCVIWDSLFWRFVLKHKDFFLKNPRTNMLAFSLNRMNQDKRDSYVKTAEVFLKNL